MKKKNKDKKRIVLTVIAIITLLTVVIGATYAYFAGFIGGGSDANIQANTGTTDSLTFMAGDPIKIHADMENFVEGKNSLKGTTTAKAKLIANNNTNHAKSKYNIFFVIEENDFVYSTSDHQAELVIKVTDPNENVVENISTLKKVNEDIFDITTRTGGYLIAADYEIETPENETEIEQTWNVEVTLINLEENQNINKGKTLNGYVYITTDQIPTYEIPKVNSVISTQTYESITAIANITPGTSEIDKYYYAIEEKQDGIALNSKIKQMSNTIAITNEDFIESDRSTYTFEGLKDNTTYTIYSYATDKQGVKSNVYSTEITTEEYIKPIINDVTFTSTLNSITANVVDVTGGDNGNNEIVKYYFSSDNGVTWSEGQTENIYTFNNLMDTTEYKIKIKVEDSIGKYSTEYYESVATETYINPSITTVTTTSKTYNSISLQVSAIGGHNNVAKYYYSIDKETWSAGQTSNNYTVSNLTEENEYVIYVKVEDANGRFSDVYDEYKETTNKYKVPTIGVETSKTYNSITLNVTTIKGDGNIKEYWYSKDNGSNWIKRNKSSLADSYTFDNLTSEVSYQVQVKAIDSNNRESNIFSSAIITDKKPLGIVCAGQNMAQCIKNNYTLDSTILLHNSSLTNGANDGSYRYAGASSSINNYVCFGTDEETCPDDNLYRVMGVFGNQIKLIKAIPATSVQLGTTGTYYSDTKYLWTSDSSSVWSTSLLNTINLNTNFLNNIGADWATKIATTTWQVGGMSYSNTNTAKQYYEVEVGSSKTETPYSAKIGLMYVSDYGYAASREHWTKNLSAYDYTSTKANNWLYLGQYEWTISRRSNTTNGVFFVNSTGSVNYNVHNYAYAIRPVFFLESTVEISSGSGTITDPIRIS